MREYKITITANVCFDYYPYEKTTSEEVPYIITHDRCEYYDEEHEIELTITPKMLLECLDFVYKHDKSESDSQMRRYELLVALEKCNWYFNKLCAEIFDEENLDDYSKVYEYLITTDEYKKVERKIIENEVRSLGELF